MRVSNPYGAAYAPERYSVFRRRFGRSSRCVKHIQHGVQHEKELESIRRGEEVAEAIRQYMLFTNGKLPDSMEKLLDERNAKWIPVIEKNIALTPSFIAVGAGHLGGKKGVLNLLRKKGYKLTPIKI